MPDVADNQRIFVNIASYADPELPRTLKDCLENARRPENLRFGICWQGDPARPVPLESFRSDNRFRFSDHPVAESGGGCWARNIAQGLWRGEQYTLQIDSHMKFEPDWDTRLVAMLHELPSEKPLISVNSPVFWYDKEGRLHRATDKGVPNSRVVDWTGDMGWAPWVDYGAPNRQRPGRQRFVTGNFVFTFGRWNEEVRQDPEHYYWGEEFAVTARSFTWGYDLFLPNEILVWHMCHFDGGPRRHWEKGRSVVDRKNEVAFERLRKLVFSDESDKLGRYGLGTARTLREFEIYSGFDLRAKRAHPDVFTGKNPDPVTIRSDADWATCITFEQARQTLLL